MEIAKTNWAEPKKFEDILLQKAGSLIVDGMQESKKGNEPFKRLLWFQT